MTKKNVVNVLAEEGLFRGIILKTVSDKMGTCVNMTGVLWVGMFEHFFNNFVSNALHVLSEELSEKTREWVESYG